MPKQILKQFNPAERRNDLYPNFLKLMQAGFETEAMILMLSTWNFARFRYAVRTFDLIKFKKALDKLGPLFTKFQREDFSSINFTNYSKYIKTIFTLLSGFKGIEKTGAPKLMHLKAPKVFVMWDGYIRKHYGFKNGDADDYVDFLILMQKNFGHLKIKSDRTLAKLVDENNFVTISAPIFKKGI